MTKDARTAAPRPPPGMDDDDDDISGRLIACAVVCQVISGLLVAARFYSRGVVTRALAREDYCILTAWVLALGFTIPSIISASVSDGRHIWTVSPEAMVISLKATYIGTLFYQLSLIFSKISILLLYMRVLHASTPARRATLALLAVVVAYGVLGAISTGSICHPIETFWDRTVEGECRPDSYMWAAIGLHVATDFLIFLLPMPVVFRMSLPRPQRISLLLVFALGFIACLVSILRAVKVHETQHMADPTWDLVVMKYWNFVEINISIVVACLLVLKPLLAKMFPSLLGPLPSPSPEDAPRTIGSVPLDRERAEERTQYPKEPTPSEKPSVYRYENQSGDVRLLGNSSAV